MQNILGRALRAAAGRVASGFRRPARAGSQQAQISADFDKDGTLDTGLAATWTPDHSTRQAQWFDVEVWRSPTIGTTGSIVGYSLWKEFTTKKPNRDFKANARFFHKIRVRQLGFNGVPGAWSAYTAVGTQPLGAGAPPAPTTVIVDTAFNFISFDITTPGTNRDILYTEVLMSPVNDMSTATLFARIEGYAAIPVFAGQQHYFWFRNINRSGVASTYYPSNPLAGVGIASPYISTTYIAQDAINANFFASDGVAQAVAAATKTMIEEVVVTYPASSAQLEIFGMFRKVTAGAHTVDITIENATGTVFKTVQNVAISTADGYGYIQTTIDAPAGTGATIRMYVLCASAISVNNTKLDVNVRKR